MEPVRREGVKTLDFLPGVDESAELLALEVLSECRKSLMMALRFLDTALWHMPYEAVDVPVALATDGIKLYFGPKAVLMRFREHPDELVRDYLHTILHCVFHHPFDNKHTDTDAWSLACDISTEVTAIELVQYRFPSASDEQRLNTAEFLKERAGALTPQALYKILQKGGVGQALFTEYGLTHQDLRDFALLFGRDSHQAWAFNRENASENTVGDKKDPLPDANRAEKESDPDMPTIEPAPLNDEDAQQDQPNTQKENHEDSPEVNTSTDQDAQTEQTADDDSGSGDAQGETSSTGSASGAQDMQPDDRVNEEALKEWTDISKKMEADLESFSKQQGNGAGSMMAELAIANRKPANYNEFLMRFATMAEDMKLNDDEFDYIFYMYGLQHYDRMPFVEPLEYKESNRVREFVIALDTSGSCSGELIKTFVTRTYDVLHQTEGFGDQINIHIVQCDNRVQSDTKITSMAELERFRNSFWLKGFGGTDFRPVFEYVDAMLKEGEFEDLRGLIYFTDGLGTFPHRAPEYQTAFVFVNDGTSRVAVPPWAMRVIMTEDEVMEC